MLVTTAGKGLSLCWTQGKANGQKPSHLSTFAWCGSWAGMVYSLSLELTSLRQRNLGARQVSLKWSFIYSEKQNSKHTFKASLEKKIKLCFKDVAWNLFSPKVLFRLTVSLLILGFSHFFFFSPPSIRSLYMSMLKMHINIGIKFTFRN